MKGFADADIPPKFEQLERYYNIWNEVKLKFFRDFAASKQNGSRKLKNDKTDKHFRKFSAAIDKFLSASGLYPQNHFSQILATFTPQQEALFVQSVKVPLGGGGLVFWIDF